VGATVYLMENLLALLSEPDVTHVGCAFDTEIRSFRDDLFDVIADTESWGIKVGRAKTLWGNLDENREAALLFRKLTTLRSDAPLKETVKDLEWKGPRAKLKTLCGELGVEDVVERAKEIWMG
jgi:5'-3' exonuclease